MTNCALYKSKIVHRQLRKAICVVILVGFTAISVKDPAYAQSAQEAAIVIPQLPAAGVMVHLSPQFTPAILKGIVIHPENAFKFDFIVYKGDKVFSEAQKREEYRKLIKYFLASLAVPDEDQWVNLSPYEKDRIIKADFGKTEMGRDLLAQDYLLKQITASLIYPQDNLGRKFWDEVYNRAYKEYGTTNIPVNTFNKVWIIPDDADIYEKGNTAYLYKSHLKVMLEEDYLSLKNHAAISVAIPDKNNVIPDKNNVIPANAGIQNTTNTIGSQVIRKIILPLLEKEVNEDKNFAPLRQVFCGMVLAAWYKRALKESLLAQVYANKSKVKGIDQDPQNNEIIYRQYLRAYKKGVFNYIQEDVDRYTNETIPRKYFSGGWAVPKWDGAMGVMHRHSESDASAAMAANGDYNLISGQVDLAATSFDPNSKNYGTVTSDTKQKILALENGTRVWEMLTEDYGIVDPVTGNILIDINSPEVVDANKGLKYFRDVDTPKDSNGLGVVYNMLMAGYKPLKSAGPEEIWNLRPVDSQMFPSYPGQESFPTVFVQGLQKNGIINPDGTFSKSLFNHDPALSDLGVYRQNAVEYRSKLRRNTFRDSIRPLYTMVYEDLLEAQGGVSERLPMSRIKDIPSRRIQRTEIPTEDWWQYLIRSGVIDENGSLLLDKRYIKDDIHFYLSKDKINRNDWQLLKDAGVIDDKGEIKNFDNSVNLTGLKSEYLKAQLMPITAMQIIGKSIDRSIQPNPGHRIPEDIIMDAVLGKIDGKHTFYLDFDNRLGENNWHVNTLELNPDKLPFIRGTILDRSNPDRVWNPNYPSQLKKGVYLDDEYLETIQNIGKEGANKIVPMLINAQKDAPFNSVLAVSGSQMTFNGKFLTSVGPEDKFGVNGRLIYVLKWNGKTYSLEIYYVNNSYSSPKRISNRSIHGTEEPIEIIKSIIDNDIGNYNLYDGENRVVSFKELFRNLAMPKVEKPRIEPQIDTVPYNKDRDFVRYILARSSEIDSIVSTLAWGPRRILFTFRNVRHALIVTRGDKPNLVKIEIIGTPDDPKDDPKTPILTVQMVSAKDDFNQYGTPLQNLLERIRDAAMSSAIIAGQVSGKDLLNKFFENQPGLKELNESVGQTRKFQFGGHYYSLNLTPMRLAGRENNFLVVIRDTSDDHKTSELHKMIYERKPPKPEFSEMLDLGGETFDASLPKLIEAIHKKVLEMDAAQTGITHNKSLTPGGIDLNAVNLDMHIKRDGKGVPLPVSQQDLQSIHIDGLVPVILDIEPVTSSPVLSQLATP